MNLKKYIHGAEYLHRSISMLHKQDVSVSFLIQYNLLIYQ